MPGEPADFRARDLSPTRHVRPHLLALLPGKERGTNLLLLGGQYASATPFLTSPSGVDAIEEMWRKHNRPAHFEAVIMAETEGETVVKAHIVAFRAAAVND
ncbi:MAG TPA: hypothetical protein VE621_23655 [Bryobacteraceae bacterium]|jgi:hypothetical protein|nr:hypothetical protein [Bryobacteraceae bacterium]